MSVNKDFVNVKISQSTSLRREAFRAQKPNLLPIPHGTIREFKAGETYRSVTEAILRTFFPDKKVPHALIDLNILTSASMTARAREAREINGGILSNPDEITIGNQFIFPSTEALQAIVTDYNAHHNDEFGGFPYRDRVFTKEEIAEEMAAAEREFQFALNRQIAAEQTKTS